MAAYVRAAVLRGLDRVIDQLAPGAGRTFLQEQGVEPELLDDPDQMLPVRLTTHVLREAMERFDAPDIALRLAARQDLQVLGALVAVIESAPTVRVALDSASRFLFVLTSNSRILVEPDPERDDQVVALVVRNVTPQEPARLFADAALGLLHRALSSFGAGAHYRPLDVYLPYADDRTAFARAFFDAPLRFNRPEPLIRVERRLLDSPVSGNESLHRLAVTQLERLYPNRGATVAAMVRDLVATSLEHSPPTLVSVARTTGQHPRTLQRHLAEEGTTFEAILDDVRRIRAHRLITGTTLPMTAISAAVGFSEASTFTRACRRWFGCSPRQLRQKATGRPT